MAEEINVANVYEPTKTESTTTATIAEKLFTQTELNGIIADRIARAKKEMPAEEELKEFRQWKTAKQTDAEKMSEMTTSLNNMTHERDDAYNERDNALKEKESITKQRDEYKSTRDKYKAERDSATNALAEANAKVEQFERERYLLKKGVPEADLDYYAFKIGKEVTEEKSFKDAADEYLKDFNGSPIAKIDTGADLSGGAGASTASETMNNIFRQARRM